MNPEKVLVRELTKSLSTLGAKQLKKDRELGREAVECSEALLADRPQYVLDDPQRELITVMAGVALGIGFAQSDAAVESAGGFEKLSEKLSEKLLEELRTR